MTRARDVRGEGDGEERVGVDGGGKGGLDNVGVGAVRGVAVGGVPGELLVGGLDRKLDVRVVQSAVGEG